MICSGTMINSQPFVCNPMQLNCDRKADLDEFTDSHIGLKNQDQFDKGDSGAGLFCLDKDKTERWVGVHISRQSGRQEVPVFNFEERLRRILSGEYPEPLKYSQRYLDAVESAFKIQALLKKNKMEMGISPAPIIPVSGYAQVLGTVEQVLSAHSEYVTRLAEAGFQNITFVDWEWWLDSHPGVDHSSIEAFCKEKDCTVIIATNVTPQQIQDFIKRY